MKQMYFSTLAYILMMKGCCFFYPSTDRNRVRLIYLKMFALNIHSVQFKLKINY